MSARASFGHIMSVVGDGRVCLPGPSVLGSPVRTGTLRICLSYIKTKCAFSYKGMRPVVRR